ncbi:hypothetical protein C2S53_003090 [Perilla frutescens var. hirtella]|uniref:NB-ARC domain-containing protein n=1 Tax=Perilla frutescens var. hirtella TaxID=608512 RepID=A0AAD4JQK2_PERFH|nr:hypothetical protein C2S53_003090 [Perilla frutescens var. hirtella]
MIMIIVQEHPFTKFSEEIASIQKWLQETKERMLEFGSAESQINYVGEELQLVGTNEDVVGLEEDVELMLRLIEDYCTICIRGMVGIGKTTLARVLYNHPKIVDGFEGHAWVCHSSWKLSRKELLINLIRQLHSKEFPKDADHDDMLILEEADNRSLRQMLHQQLRCKRYFIVLDDVSEDTYLKYLCRHALPHPVDTLEGNRLLFTTCDGYISKMYGTNKHEMKNLDDDKSWQLLLKTALYGSNDDEKFPKQLERKGREDLSETLAALESTYLKLDAEAKPCFFRLAFFKEGTPIRRNKLLKIWTVSGGQNERMMSLIELIRESIIEVKQKTKFHHSYIDKTYRINDVFHMLSIRKAKDEIGFEILRKDGNNNRAASHEPRHRVIHRSRDDKFNFNYSSTNQDKHLLSLFFHGGGFSDIATPSYWNHFEQLKILDMEGFGLKILPETVGELTELIYLELRNNCIQELPRSLGRLRKLEVFDIALNFMVAVPDIIWEMESLQHLYMSNIICQKPLKIDALRNLQTLTYISVDNWTYELSGFKMMATLCKLGIEEVDENTDISKLFASLAELDHIYSLILRGFHFRSLPSLDGLGILRNVHELKLEGHLTRLPTANNFPPELWRLALVNSCLDEDPMPILEKLPELKGLHLQNAYAGQQMVISPYGFGELDELVIEELWHLRNLQVGQHALEILRRLEINSCPYLDTLPEEFHPTYYYPELKIVTTKNIATKIRESGFISRMKKVDIQP